MLLKTGTYAWEGDEDPAFLSPINRRMLRYWRDKVGDRPMPARRDLHLRDCPDLWAHFGITGVERDAAGGVIFRQRFMGTTVSAFYGDLTGVQLEDFPLQPETMARTRKAYELAVESRLPVITNYTTTFAYDENAGRIAHATRVEGVTCPLSPDGGETVDQLIGTLVVLKD